MKEHFALVTGASSGMGLEFAKQLAHRGYNLLIVSNVPEINGAAEEIKKGLGDERVNGLEVIPLVMDLGQQSSARELYDYAHTHELEIEVLINNAGVYHDRDILDDSEGFTSLILNLHMYTPAMLSVWSGYESTPQGLYSQCMLGDFQDGRAALRNLRRHESILGPLHPSATYRVTQIRRTCNECQSRCGRYGIIQYQTMVNQTRQGLWYHRQSADISSTWTACNV